MSIASEITRIQTAKENIKTSIINKGGTLSNDAPIDEYASAISSIPTSAPVTESLSVTQNGTYTPSAGVDGFDEVMVNVPTGGGGGLTLIDTIDVDGVYSKEIVVNPDWFDGFDGLIFVPYLTFSAREWLYINPTNTVISISYWPGANDTVYGTEGYAQSAFVIKRGSGYEMNWFIDMTSRFKQSAFEFESSFFMRLYDNTSTMTGTIKVYGIKITP